MIKSVSINLNFGYIIVAIFAVPLFMAVPEWYIMLEIPLAIFMIIVSFISTGALLGIVYMAMYKDVPLLEENYWSRGTLIGFGVVVVILTSMYIQNMIILFSLYLIGFILNQGIGIVKLWVKGTEQ